MRSVISSSLALLHLARLLFALAMAALAGLSAAADTTPTGRVIVKYKALGSLMRSMEATPAQGQGPRHAAAMARRTGLALTDGRVIDRRTQVVWGSQGISSAALAARLAADAEVEYAVPDERRHALALPNDPLLAASAAVSPAVGQWYLRAPDATVVSAINAVGAWAISAGTASVVVADIDTGVLFDHPDLTNKLYPGYDFITTSSVAGDGGARDADATDAGDWTSVNECGRGVAATSSSWHGTQTSGLIGAQTNNGVGMASVGNEVMVLPVRVLGKCGGSDSDIIAAMLWAGGVSSLPVANPHPARVINLSLGSSGSCNAAYADAVSQLTAAGVVVVAAAGNEEGLAVGTPANCAGVIAVAGLRHQGTKVGFSSLGPEVSVSAPAGNCVNTSGACLYPILTTTNTGTQAAATHTYSDSTNYSLGTSFSAPLVAGTVGLMLSANPAMTPAQVKAAIKSTARSFPSSSSDTTVTQCKAPSSTVQNECLCTTSTCGAGMLDAAAAVAAAANSSVPIVSLSASAKTVLAGGTVTLDGSASIVGTGRTVANYRWAITSGSGIATLSGGTTGASTVVTTSGTGSLTVQLTVTDSAGAQASASTTVTVTAPAAPTVKLLVSSSVVAAGGMVTFDGSGSSAASGLSVASYQWTITSGASLASFTSSSSGASVVTASTVGSSSGDFTVRLTVTDSLGQSTSASTTVSVTAVVPVASIAASSLTVTAGTTVSLDGSGSTAVTERSITSYAWSITSGSNIATFSGSITEATAKVTASGAGSFTVQLTVTDSAGAKDTRTASVTVSAAPAASGGGALGAGWLAGMGLAVLALGWRRPQHQRQQTQNKDRTGRQIDLPGQ
jgi:serine protease